MKLNVPPPPQKLFRQFEAGEITREELQATCAMHQREMLAEIEESYRNPVGAYFEDLLLKREAARLRRNYGEGPVREVLEALAEVPDFPPAILLWNAGHRDVPLQCFLRLRREPIFRFVELRNDGPQMKVTVEHGSRERKKTTREEFTLHRAAGEKLVVVSQREI